ncbi:carboxylesterase [Aspergillus steynii IBT 23096]|uniref:Carboxylesterase n=1 Tax=Aspergillus steynii IBT 23096 TaxID=1392250 RepID=A0A2I2G9U6_9EURO|nr:carboxylesterase [Aspergillus steynii IBT 23096]PLB49651.1 carboxylesterase [Aspergillus steynii IBT 23096]
MLQLRLTVVALLGQALAAPAPSVPHADALGTLQALHYNNLGPANNGTSAVFVHDIVTHAEASARCGALGEQLYPLAAASKANRTELDYQFDYLIFSDSLQSDNIWVSSNTSNCLAYSLEQADFVSTPCSRKLPALCTSHVPPTTDQNRAAVPSSRISVASHDYTITGYRDARSFRFLGIPFANPPVNALRLAPPQPYTGAKQIEATQVSASCIQSSSSFGALDTPISEDCLYLNVYTPVLPGPSNATKPVAVYFYGGAFTAGSASIVDYDGGNFASRNDVLVVTVNYRVGVLGWLATSSLTGNYGTRDQILALQWVQQHIRSFGGDPSRVTIFGQSAGGQSVVALLSSPAAKGLFSAAIVQSAPLDLPWFTRSVYTDLIVPALAPALGCPHHMYSDASLVACLRSLPSSAFLDNSTTFESAIANASAAVASKYLHSSSLLASIEPLLPILDPESGIIADQFHSLLNSSSGGLNKVPTLFSTVADEAALYVPRYSPPLGSSQSAFNALLGLAYPAPLAGALINASAYTTSPSPGGQGMEGKGGNDSVRILAATALTQSEWTCPLSSLLRTANHTTQTNQTNHPQTPWYNLKLEKGHIQTTLSTPPTCSPRTSNAKNATCHAADVLPIWGTLNTKTQHVDAYYDARDVLLSQLLADVWGAFVRSGGDPNPNSSWLSVSKGGEGNGRGDGNGKGGRGPAYQYTREVFGEDGEGFRIAPVGQSSEVSVLGRTQGKEQDPGKGVACRVFEEFGFTYDRAGFT